MQERGHRSTIVTLGPREGLADTFQGLGVPVFALTLRPSLSFVAKIFQFRRILAEARPDIVQGWMYHANLMLSLAARALPESVPVLWNIRRGLDDIEDRKSLTKALIKISAVASRYSDKIIYCTERSRQQHEELGFIRDRGIVINNGFLPERFYKSAERRDSWRSKFGLAEHHVAIGNVGRYDIAKGHIFLLEAFQKLLRVNPNCRLVLVGRGIAPTNQELKNAIHELGLSEQVVLFGECARVEEVYSAFDIYCSSSVAEGFPNVVAEAMLSELPCVVTDTGAARELVEGIGHVVPPRDSAALADALHRAIELVASPALGGGEGDAGRKRIIERYSLSKIMERYDQLYRSMVSSSAASGHPIASTIGV
jgi:glycosyltransferase involved in cell wall biosynthesis